VRDECRKVVGGMPLEVVDERARRHLPEMDVSVVRIRRDEVLDSSSLSAKPSASWWPTQNGWRGFLKTSRPAQAEVLRQVIFDFRPLQETAVR
jgi:hypothetical protein